LGVLAGCDQQPRQDTHHKDAKAPAKPSLLSLDGLIRFSDPKECIFTEPMDRLFASLIRSNPDYTISPGQPAIPRSFASAFGQPTSTTNSDHLLTVTMPVRGTWRGLRVVKISASAMPESDVMWNTIRFAAPKEAVIKRLNEAGMPLPPSGQRRHADEGDPMEFAVQLFVHGPVTDLECS